MKRHKVRRVLIRRVRRQAHHAFVGMQQGCRHAQCIELSALLGAVFVVGAAKDALHEGGHGGGCCVAPRGCLRRYEWLGGVQEPCIPFKLVLRVACSGYPVQHKEVLQGHGDVQG